MDERPAVWRVLGASVTGSSHREGGRGCDDAHGIRQIDGDLLLLAVADGAGSASRSADGAARAVQAALESAAVTLSSEGIPPEAVLWQAILGKILRDARSGVEALASITPQTIEAGAAGAAMQPEPARPPVPETVAAMTVPEPEPVPLREFASTLLLALATPDWIAAAQVGDGAVVMQDAEGVLEVLTRPEHGEYLNETTFVTADDYLDRAQYVVRSQPGLKAVALLSDGLQMLALNLERNEAYAPFFGPLLAFAAQAEATEADLAAFLDSERVCARTDDDKTLILAVRVCPSSDATTRDS